MRKQYNNLVTPQEMAEHQENKIRKYFKIVWNHDEEYGTQIITIEKLKVRLGEKLTQSVFKRVLESKAYIPTVRLRRGVTIKFLNN